MVLGIYGSGGLGHEVEVLANLINLQNSRWESIIYIDDFVKGNCIMTIEDAVLKYGLNDLEIVIAIGEPEIRKQVIAFLKLNHNIRFSTLIHPTVIVPDSTVIGEGTVINFGTFISCNTIVGSNVYIHPNVNIGHNCNISSNVVISGMCNIAGEVTILGNTYLGMSSAIREGITIGSYVIIGMGAVVMKSVDGNDIVMGNPGRVFGKNVDLRVFK